MCGGTKTVNNTTTTQASADLPAWAKPYFERNIAKAEAEFGKPYEGFTGDRLAGPDAATLQSRQQMEVVAGTGVAGLGMAQQAAQQGMQTAQQLGQYSPTQFSEFQYQQPQTFTGANVSQYMSPYQQNVTNVQKAEAIKDFNRLQGARDAQAVQAGAFGGSRQGVQQALAQEQVLDQLANIQATGQQKAFESAAQQFGADRAAQMTAEQRQAAELGRVQTGTEAAQQFGAGQGLAALEAGTGLGQELTRLGELGRQTDIQNAQLLEGVGAARTAEEQAQLDLDYQDFLAQRDFGRQQVSDMTGILAGMPIAATGTTSGTSTQQSQAPGAFQQAVGAGLSGLSLYKAFG